MNNTAYMKYYNTPEHVAVDKVTGLFKERVVSNSTIQQNTNVSAQNLQIVI
jgi:hypothetical protein